MKRLIIIYSILILISCGSNDKKKKGFEYNRTQKEIKKNEISETNKVPIDLNNKGIGPIKELQLIKLWQMKVKKLSLLNAQLVIWLREN